MSRLPPTPQLDWTEEGVPRSSAFGDVYFSRAGGLAESEAVFLTGCGLPEAWRGKDRFAICELGFGAGLNVLCAWRAWKKTRSPHAILHICSVEAFPLGRDDAARALSSFPEISDLSEALLQRWPVRAHAPQRCWFAEDNFALTLFTGEAEAILADLHGRFDAWFLDGFAPARNPAMWSPQLFGHIARLSAPGARAATYSVSGPVRRGLEAAGFTVARKPGFGAKRERLEAFWTAGVSEPLGRPAGEDAGGPRGAPYPYAPCFPKRVAIIGAGVAGAATAHALARRGVETVALDAAPRLGEGASGNPAALVMPRLDRGGMLSSFHLAAFLNAVALYEALGAFARCGVEQRPQNGDAAALADLIADPPLPPDWFAPAGAGAALHARAGLAHPAPALAAMLRGAHLMLETRVGALDESDGGWIVRAPEGRALLKADAVVLACGVELAAFAPASFISLAQSFGQIEWARAKPPANAIVQGGYVAPFDGGVLFGATFDKHPAAQADARRRNLETLAALAPESAASLDAATLRSRVSARATTPDRAPLAGLLPDADAWRAQYAALAQGGRIDADARPPAHAGLYVLGGLGARGFTLAPLLAERLVSEMCGEPSPLPRSVLDALHPARFLHRALKRG